MNVPARASVAYVAARLSDGRNASSAYDFDRGRYVQLTGTVTDGNVNVYDFDRACFISGSGNSGNVTLYDFGTSAHVNLQVTPGGGFNGYDYSSGTFFNGTVLGRNVAFYDYEDGRVHNYTV